MKSRLLTITLFAGLAAAACSKQETAATAPAGGSTTAATTGPREIDITANDQMKYNITSIEAKAGEQLKVVLTNTGTLPKEAMGHNWTLLKQGTDVAAFAAAAATAKDTDYVPPALKDQVIAHTQTLGPRKSDEVTFTVPAPGDYTFICTFPGHFVNMKGTLTVK